jgi:hypothetical protein
VPVFHDNLDYYNCILFSIAPSRCGRITNKNRQKSSLERFNNQRVHNKRLAMLNYILTDDDNHIAMMMMMMIGGILLLPPIFAIYTTTVSAFFAQ